MKTLESIVESLKIQLKPHLNDDVKLYDEFIIRIINDTRSALIRSINTAGGALNQFFQETTLLSVPKHINVDSSDRYLYSNIDLPSSLLNGAGYKNIRSIRTASTHNSFMHYCSYQEFLSYNYHVYQTNDIVVCDMGGSLLVKHSSLDKPENENIFIDAIFEYPEQIESYSYEDTPYPIGANHLHQLELISFQHIASKLGMPSDVINNGYDETRNANIPQPKQQKEREPKEEQQ